MSAAAFFSIAPFLPLQVDLNSGLLQWRLPVEYALKAVARGPTTSHVTDASALFDFIEDLRNENGDLQPLSPQISNGLRRLFDEVGDTREFFTNILPNIAELALQLPDLLMHHEKESTRLPAVGLSSLTLRVLPSQQPGMVLLRQGAAHARNRNVQKLLCLINYFKRVCSTMPEGAVSFERKVLPRKSHSSASVPNRGFWSDSKQPLCEMKVIQNGNIDEAGSDYLTVDFANEQLGGGALHNGCLQEEIRFMISPECIAGMMFFAIMRDNESIEIIGAEVYSAYSGEGKKIHAVGILGLESILLPTHFYKESSKRKLLGAVQSAILQLRSVHDDKHIFERYRQSFCFAGDHIDNTPRDSLGRRKTCIVAIDALCLPGESQFEDDWMIRELDKAYCGFLNHSVLCGFLGDPNALGTGKDNSGPPGTYPGTHDPEEIQGLECGAEYEVRLDRESLDKFSFMDSDEAMTEGSPRAKSTGSCIIHQKLKGVATGNWGAGAFGGDLQLKSLLQWLAASQAGCPTVLYYCFDDPRCQRLQEVVDWILQERWCVSELWSILQRYGKCRMNWQVKCELFNWILPKENMDFDMLNIV